MKSSRRALCQRRAQPNPAMLTRCLPSPSAQIALTGFLPDPNGAALRSFGIPQDEAARTNAPAAQDIALSNPGPVSTNFNFSFPALSLTLSTFAPAVAPSVTSQPQPLSVLAGSNATFTVPSNALPRPESAFWSIC
jgi:hypothetical protein